MSQRESEKERINGMKKEQSNANDNSYDNSVCVRREK